MLHPERLLRPEDFSYPTTWVTGTSKANSGMVVHQGKEQQGAATLHRQLREQAHTQKKVSLRPHKMHRLILCFKRT